MSQNFLGCDRERVLLMPVSLREWLPEGHLVWFVLELVAGMDLSAFYAAYREDGHGRAAHDPAMMVALLMYAFARGQRSSRGIERKCIEDIAYRRSRTDLGGSMARCTAAESLRARKGNQGRVPRTTRWGTPDKANRPALSRHLGGPRHRRGAGGPRGACVTRICERRGLERPDWCGRSRLRGGRRARW